MNYWYVLNEISCLIHDKLKDELTEVKCLIMKILLQREMKH